MAVPRSPSPVDIPEYFTQFKSGSDDEKNLWEAVEILGESAGKYLVRWSGVDPSTKEPWPDSWVPKYDCTNDLIRDWKLKKAKLDHVRKRKRKGGDELQGDPNAAHSTRKISARRSSTSHVSKKDIRSLRPRKSFPVVEIPRSKKRKLSTDMHDVGKEIVQRKEVLNQSKLCASGASSKFRSSAARTITSNDETLEIKPLVTMHEAPDVDDLSQASSLIDASVGKGSVAKVNGTDRSKLADNKIKAMKAKGLHTVPTMSPSIFRKHSAKSCGISAIEEFTPDPLQRQLAKGKGKGEIPASYQKKLVSYPQREEEEESTSEEEHQSGSGSDRESDDVDDVEENEVALRRWIGQLPRRTSSLDRTCSTSRKPLEPVISHKSRSLSTERDLFKKEAQNLQLQASSSRRHQGTKQTTRSLSSVQSATRDESLYVQNEYGDSQGEENEGGLVKVVEQEADDVLRPEDAPDASLFVPFIPWLNTSTELHPSLTQPLYNSAVIVSPVRQLDSALGLLHRKSAEIAELQEKLEAQTAQVNQLGKREEELRSILEETRSCYEVLETQLKAKETVPSDIAVNGQRPESAPASSSEEQCMKMAALVTQIEELRSAVSQLESDKELLRKVYDQASAACMEKVDEIRELARSNESLRQQATSGVKQANVFWESRVHILEKELDQTRGTVEVLTEQLRRTEDVRRKAAMLPMAEEAVQVAKQENERWHERFMDMGEEITRLRLEVKKWEDEALARSKEARAAEELVFLCPWRGPGDQTRCAELLTSREKLCEHFYEARHFEI